MQKYCLQGDTPWTPKPIFWTNNKNHLFIGGLIGYYWYTVYLLVGKLTYNICSAGSRRRLDCFYCLRYLVIWSLINNGEAFPLPIEKSYHATANVRRNAPPPPPPQAHQLRKENPCSPSWGFAPRYSVLITEIKVHGRYNYALLVTFICTANDM